MHYHPEIGPRKEPFDKIAAVGVEADNTAFDLSGASMLKTLTGLLAVLSLIVASPALAGPAVGHQAPDFKLQDQNGAWHSLADTHGQWVALYFYPKDDTPGCTTEACAFRDDIFKFKKMNVAILGVSLDDVESHKEFADKYHLPFPLLADTEHTAAKAYDVVRNFGITKIAKRQTFLIDPDCRIAKHYEKVDADVHSEQVLADLKRLMTTADAK